MAEAAQIAPAAERNKDPILAVLRDALPARGLVLELASGTGQHAIHFARALPSLVWQPSDPDPAARGSIEAWIAESGLPNLRPPLDLDAGAASWPIEAADALVCINMIHIAPWDAAVGLFRGAAGLLPPGGVLVFYGPFRQQGQQTAPSNEAFDAQLQQRDSAWGLRDLEAVAEEALRNGLLLDRVIEMPANNLSVIFQRASAALSGSQ